MQQTQQPNQPIDGTGVENVDTTLSDWAEQLRQNAETVEEMQREAEKIVEEKMKGDETLPPPPADPEAKDGSSEDLGLFKVVVDSIMRVVNDPTIIHAFNNLKEKFNLLGKPGATEDSGDIAKELIEVLSMSISYSVVMSINYYDFQLKQSLDRDFGTANEIFTKIESDLLATNMKLSALENKIALTEANASRQ